MASEGQQRLEIVDRLFERRLDEYVALPQLVVVGDQSSGKSSVLEALTNGLPFPRDSGLCTRFPAQIVFQRSKVQKVEISILPSHSRRTEEKAELQKFNEIVTSELTAEKFLSVIQMASRAMGIPDQRIDTSEAPGFATDVLKIEMFGPTLTHFSVVDLPGLFRKPTPPITTLADTKIVKDLVLKYIQNPRSIILAVVPANIDIATQEIIQMAEDEDPDKKRTLYVLTKPDLVDKGAEDKVLDLIHDSHLALGFSVVCNRSQSLLDTSIEERNEYEKNFFTRLPWSAIPPNRAGIKALRQQLDSLLLNNTKENLQAVRIDLENELREAKSELQGLGATRQTATTQRMFLNEIASSFQDLAMKAVESSYSRDEFFEEGQSRLARNIGRVNEAFARTMATRGAYRKFARLTTINGEKQQAAPNVTGAGAYSSEISDEEKGFNEPVVWSPKQLHPQIIALKDQLAGIKDPWLPSIFLEFETKPIKQPAQGIVEWMTAEYNDYRGFTISGMTPALFPMLFAEQTRLWPVIALSHAIKCICAVHGFIQLALAKVCEDEHVQDRLKKHLLPILHVKYKRALEHLNFLLEVERDGYLITQNHYYAENVQSFQNARLEQKLRDAAPINVKDRRAEPILSLGSITRVYRSNSEQAIEELHDSLKSYYKVALKRFVDNFCQQAIGHFLISRKDGPLFQLNGHWVGSLSDEKLAYFGGEVTSLQARRKKLQEKVETLEQGLKIIEQSWTSPNQNEA